MKQLFYLMLLGASIFIISCNKETGGIANTTPIETPKSVANVISLDEAKTTFARAAKEATSWAVGGGTPLNLADFDPQWSQASNINYVDTSGNALTIPTTVFESGGYKKLTFFRMNGQVTFLVATVIGTPEYLVRKNGICTMSDFCGYVYYTNTEGVSTGGYKLDNGVVIALLVPKTTPTPELQPSYMLDEVVVTDSRISNGGGLRLPLFINTGSFTNYLHFSQNTFWAGINGNNGDNGGVPPNNTPLDGSAPPPVNANLCPTTFTVIVNNTGNMTKDMGVKDLYLPMLISESDNNWQSVGFDGLSIYIPNTNVDTNQPITDAQAARIAASAINIGQGLLQLKITRGEIATTQAAMKKEFIKLASQYIDEKTGRFHPSVRVPHLTWELSGPSLMAYRTPVTGCP